MTADHTTSTTEETLPTRRTRTRVLAGIGIAASLTAATVTGAGIASAGDEPTTGSQVVEDTAGQDGLVWVPEAGTWLVEDSGTQVVEDRTAGPDQEFNEQTGLVWNEQAGTWMFADTATDTDTGTL